MHDNDRAGARIACGLEGIDVDPPLVAVGPEAEHVRHGLQTLELGEETEERVARRRDKHPIRRVSQQTE